MGVDAAGAQQAGHRGGDHFAGPLLFAADRDHHRKIGRDDLRIELQRQVLLVDQGDGPAPGAALGQGKVLFGQRLRPVKDGQHQPGLGQLGPAAADALGLHRVVGIPQAGGVEQIEADVPQLDRLLHHVPGGAGDGGDDGPVEAGQQVEQGGFARVGPAHDGAVHPFPQDGGCVIAADQLVQRGLDLGQGVPQGAGLQGGNVLLREIHPGGQMGLQAGQGLLLGGDLAGQGAAAGRVGQGSPLPPARRDQVHHRLGLGQAEFAVEEGAPGVLPRAGRDGPRPKAGFHQAAGHRGAPMAGQFHHVLAGIAVGRTEKQGDAVVKEVVPVGELPVQGGVTFGVRHPFAAVHRAEHPLRDGVALGPRQAHHRDAALAGGRRDGRNGSVFQHMLSTPFLLVLYHVPAENGTLARRRFVFHF